MPVSELFDPTRWVEVDGFTELADLTYHHDTTGRIARIAFDLATVAAWAALGTSALAVLGGIAAAIGNWDRGAAVAGIVLGLFGNPLVLTFGLGAAANV